MKLVIELDDKVYKQLKRDNFLNMSVQEIRDVIRNGTTYTSARCKDCILDDGKVCVLEYYPCIYEALDFVYRRKEKGTLYEHK